MNKEIYLELEDTQWPYGHISHDRNTVRAIVLDNEGYFYFIRANRDDIFGKATMIETSGGGVEEREDLIEALNRELKEELSAQVDILCKIGTVSDYYNILHRHNISNYYLCKIKSFGDRNLTEAEKNIFHISTLKLTYEQAIKEYKDCANTKIGKLVANRELPILYRAKEIIDSL